MMSFIVHRYKAIFVFAIMMVLLGFQSYFALPRESAPEIRRPKIFISTMYQGVSPTDIESLITSKIETEVHGLSGLDSLKSTSYNGMSVITATFTGQTDVEWALRHVKERVDLAKPKLPTDAEEPVVKELDFSDQPFLIITVSHPNGLHKIEHYADKLEDAIENIAGVRGVDVSGRQEKILRIELNPVKMRHYGVSIDDVQKVLRNEHVSIPGGTLSTKGRKFSLAVSGELKTEEHFRRMVIQTKTVSVELVKFATVKFDYEDPISYAKLNGKPAISLAVKKRSGENMLWIADKIKALMEETKNQRPTDTVVDFPFDESLNIASMVRDLENNILSGLFLVLLVTLFFLGPVNALFVSLAIPFSMLMTFFVISIFGFTLNMVVLFSLVIGLGMLVDNGIVIVENIYRHAGLGKTRTQAAIDGAKEIALPIATSTLTTILAFFPIVFMPGIMGEFMSYLPKTVIIVLISSLVVGLTITTVFCSRFLRTGSVAKKMPAIATSEHDLEAASKVKLKGFERFKMWYERSLEMALSWPILTLLSVFFIVFLGMFLQFKFGSEALFFPHLDPSTANIEIKLPAGTSLDKTEEYSQKVLDKVNETKGSIQSVQSTIGTSNAMGPGGRESFRARIQIIFDKFAVRTIPSANTIKELKGKYDHFAGAEITVKKGQDGPPQGNDISYQIHGEDYSHMGEISEQILLILRQYQDKLGYIESDFEAAKPEYQIKVDRDIAGRAGISTRLIAQTVRTAINGNKVGTLKKNGDDHDIILRYQPPYRSHIDAIKNLDIVKEGKRIPLMSLAKISRKQTLSEVKRYKRKRAITVSADFLEGVSNKAELTAKIDEQVKALSLKQGYEIVSGEGQEVRDESTRFLLQAFVFALFLIFMVLIMQFNSVVQPLLILISVFLSIGGVFWGLYLSQQKFIIIMSGIGVISLAGVVVNNAIVLIDFYNHVKIRQTDLKLALIEASATRLRPVLLTAITTIIGLFPMAFGVSFDFHTFGPGAASESSQWWASMAWTIIYGLTFATLLTLFVIPCLLFLTERRSFEKSKLVQKSDDDLMQE